MRDIYYDPAAFGLELIWTAEATEPYEFDIVAAWGSTLTGAVHLGRDSGCSCPSPFEEYTEPDSVNQLTRVDPERGRTELRAAILGVMRSGGYQGWALESRYGDDRDRLAREDQDRYSADGADRILDWAAGRRLEAPR